VTGPAAWAAGSGRQDSFPGKGIGGPTVPKLLSNPRPPFPPLLSFPRGLLLHPSLFLECSICRMYLGLHRSKETLLSAGHVVHLTLSEASHWTRICCGSWDRLGVAAYSALRGLLCYMGHSPEEQLSHPMALRCLLSLPLLPLWPESPPRSHGGSVAGMPRPTGGASLVAPCPAHVAHLSFLHGQPQPRQPQRCCICIK